ncbi:MAG: hypothetical protein HC911_17860 [Chloroflexaceae bacterium]|nr:hypothetical protein [Chloroflexaceae bacterium]
MIAVFTVVLATLLAVVLVAMAAAMRATFVSFLSIGLVAAALAVWATGDVAAGALAFWLVPALVLGMIAEVRNV